MNLFSETDYQKILYQVVEERKQIDPASTFQGLATATRIPKSYLSKVVHGKAHLSQDQLFLVCDALGFDARQRAYLLLLLDYARSEVKKRKSLLLSEIRSLQAAALDSREHLRARPDSLSEDGLKSYYLDPLHQIIHICLSVKRYQKDLARLAGDLGLRLPSLMALVERLEALGIVERTPAGLKTLVKTVHLPKDSPVFRPWRNGLKLLCLERLNRRAHDDDYSFSVTFSASPETKRRIQAEFLQLLKKVESWVGEAEQTEAYQMSFDLFAWTT